MALNYADLLGDVGKLIKEFDAFRVTAEALPARKIAVQNQFDSDDQLGAIEGIDGIYEDYRDSYAARRGQLQRWAVERLLDQTTVLDEIGAANADLNTVLGLLILQMGVDAQSINSSVVAIGGITPSGTGNGSLLITTTLDGLSSPADIYLSQIAYAGLPSELAFPSEDMLVICTQDSYSGNLAEGNEVFQWTGQIKQSQFTTRPEGSGFISSLTGIHNSNSQMLKNADFENFGVANTPDSWTIDAGAAGTEVFQDTTATNFYHGVSGLKFVGTAAAAIQVSQAVSLTPYRGYVFSLRIKADAGVAAGTFTAEFEGTGYAASATEKIVIAFGALPTAWTLKTFVIIGPAIPPSDMKLVLKWTGTPTATKKLWLDDLALGTIVYGGGIGAAMIRGSTPWLFNDRRAFAITNTEGVVQRFSRSALGVQLRSSVTPTIADTVAT